MDSFEYKPMEAYIDESGAIRASGPFVAGIWFTSHPLLWRKIIREQRVINRYGYELHFHKISKNRLDRRYITAREIFKKLRSVKGAWYSRLIYVDECYLDRWREHKTIDIYDTFMAEMVLKFASHAKTNKLVLTIDHKNRPTSDDFLPVGLQELINIKSKKYNGPEVVVKLKESANEDLLQLVDLLTASIRHIYHPSQNPNKAILSKLMEPLIDDRIRVLEWAP